MRKQMREQSKKSEMQEMLSARKDNGNRLYEKWAKTKGIGEGLDQLMEQNPDKARNTAIVLENQENHIGRLTETQISNTFSTTPENVIRVVRLGYPNSVRGEIFLEWAMETARDSIYYLSPVYGKSKRGASTGDVYHESAAYRYGSEIEVEDVGTGDGTTTEFTTTVDHSPLRPYTVRILKDDEPIATDNGNGTIYGQSLDENEANTIDYTSGELTITFNEAPDADADIQVEYHFDSEEESLYSEIGSVELQLRDHQFRVKPWPLYVSWSKMTELLLNTTLNIDAEEALVRGAADELKKSLDFHAIRLGHQAAKKNATVEFDVEGATGESEVDRAMAFSRAIDQASDIMFNKVQRGGVTKMVGGPDATSYVKLHRRFDGGNAQPRVGAHRLGSLDGIDLYKAPNAVVPDDEILAVYHNEDVPEDVSIAFGSLVPLYRTQTLEFKEFYSETGLSYFGDSKVLNNSYLVRIKLNNL